jgi:hypothetical protein
MIARPKPTDLLVFRSPLVCFLLAPTCWLFAYSELLDYGDLTFKFFVFASSGIALFICGGWRPRGFRRS